MGLYHPSLTGMASGTGTSGSTAWEGSFRSRLYLQLDERGTRKLTRPKSNYSKTDEEHPLMWRDGYLFPSSMFKSADLSEKWGAAFLECLQEAGRIGKDISPSYNSANYYGKVFPESWRMIDGRHKAITRKQFEKAFVQLEFNGVIKVEEATTKHPRRVIFTVSK
jgi:hypothetical protein